MVKMYKAPEPYECTTEEITIFLAGSIEMDTAEKWQDRILENFKDFDNIVLLNPRRDAWDSTIEQSVSNPEFYKQVDWEFQGLHTADIIALYFDPNTKSPITLLELGLMAATYSNIVVCCPEGFWRKGNVEYICQQYDIPLTESFDEFCASILETVRDYDIRID